MVIRENSLKHSGGENQPVQDWNIEEGGIKGMISKDRDGEISQVVADQGNSYPSQTQTWQKCQLRIVVVTTPWKRRERGRYRKSGSKLDPKLLFPMLSYLMAVRKQNQPNFPAILYPFICMYSFSSDRGAFFTMVSPHKSSCVLGQTCGAGSVPL